MAYVKGQPFKPQFTDPATNTLMSNGTIEFYLTGTSTPTPFYTDSAGTSGGTSLALDIGGKPSTDVFFDTAITYKLVVKNAAGGTVDTLEPFTVGSIAEIATIADIRTASLADKGSIQTLGYASAGDGGGATYWADTNDNSTADDGFLCIVSADGIRFKLQIDGPCNIKTAGAVGDGVTDNTAAIQATINTGASVHMPDGVFAFASQITNPDMVPITGPGKLLFTGSGEHAFIFGAADGSAHQYPSTVMSNIYLERATKDWTDAYGGVCLFNTEGHQLTIHSRNFYYPVYMQGNDAGCTFNNYYIKLAGDGVSQILMHSSGTTGWVNQNNIYGGRFFTISATSSALDVSGIEFKADASTLNGNVFYNPSFELYNTGAGITQAFKGSGTTTDIAIKNQLIGGRLEATNYLLGGKGVFENEFSPASTQYAASTVSDLLNPDSADDLLVLMQNKFDVIAGDLGLDEVRTIATLNRTNMVTQQPAGTELGCKPARGVIFEAAAVDQLVFHDAAITLKHDSFVNASSDTVIGFLLDFRNVQEDYTKIITVKAVTAATGGRVAAVCFDGSYNNLEGSGDCSLTFNSGNGLYRTGSDLTSLASEQKIAFGADVDYAIVGVVQGGAAADLRSMEILAIGRADIHICYDPQAVTGLTVKTVNSIAVSPIIDSDTPMATQSPLTPVSGNSYAAGTDVNNADPAAAEAAGWVYNGSAWLAKAALT